VEQVQVVVEVWAPMAAGRGADRQGLAYLKPGRVEAPVLEEPPPVVTFEAIALEYLERLVKPNP
jgi:hypothetical protein